MLLYTLALVVTVSECALADEHLQTSKEYYSQLFVQNSPLDRLKKRSAKHRWNQLRRERLKSADANEKSPEKLDGSPDKPVPLPEVESVPESALKSTIPESRPLVIENGAADKIDDAVNGAPVQNSRDQDSPVSAKIPVRIPIKSPTVEDSAPVTAEAPQPTPVPVPEASPSIQAQPNDTYREPARSPSELKAITAISPFRNYEPDLELAATDPCNNLCPRPDGMPCVRDPGSRTPECPEEITLGDQVYSGRYFAENCYNWEPSNIFSHPLYFEDAALERTGQTYHDVVQPFVSVGKFGTQLIGLPYQMVLDHPCKKVYPLGWYRAGDCAPKRITFFPWNTEAALVQAAAVTGVLYLFP